MIQFSRGFMPKWKLTIYTDAGVELCFGAIFVSSFPPSALTSIYPNITSVALLTDSRTSPKPPLVHCVKLRVADARSNKGFHVFSAVTHKAAYLRVGQIIALCAAPHVQGSTSNPRYAATSSGAIRLVLNSFDVMSPFSVWRACWAPISKRQFDYVSQKRGMA